MGSIRTPLLILLLALPAAPALAADSDGDSIPDDVECPDDGQLHDSDNDGLQDCFDDDDDGDGVPTLVEVGLVQPDADGDGIPNHLDTDDDNNGVPSADETDPLGDEDQDGILNFADVNDDDGPAGDLDRDGLANALEAALGTDPADADSDNDGVFDGREVGDAAGTGTLPDTDGDGRPDVFDTDDDNDGIPTSMEYFGPSFRQGRIRLRGDIDWQPGVPLEPLAGFGLAPPGTRITNDVDRDGIPNYLDTDSDGDGKSDHDEVFSLDQPEIGDVPRLAAKVKRFELANGNVTRLRVFTRQFPDRDQDGIPDFLDAKDFDGPAGDIDSDGISNRREERLGTDPYNPDSDGDGVGDKSEQGDSDGDGIPDKLDPDDDNDRILSIDEGSGDGDDDGIPNRLDTDSDGDGILDREEGNVDIDGDFIANYLDTDSDDDGVPDGSDAVAFNPCGDGVAIPDGTNINNGCVDRDCDGIPDNQESTQIVYGNGYDMTVHTGDGTMLIELDGEFRPSLFDGPCAFADYDCDGIPNLADPDWTDGPGVNGQGSVLCGIWN